LTRLAFGFPLVVFSGFSGVGSPLWSGSKEVCLHSLFGQTLLVVRIHVFWCLLVVFRFQVTFARFVLRLRCEVSQWLIAIATPNVLCPRFFQIHFLCFTTTCPVPSFTCQILLPVLCARVLEFSQVKCNLLEFPELTSSRCLCQCQEPMVCVLASLIQSSPLLVWFQVLVSSLAMVRIEGVLAFSFVVRGCLS